MEVIKYSMNYKFVEDEVHDPIPAREFGIICSTLEDEPGEVIFESEDIEEIQKFYDSIPQPVAKWDKKKSYYSIDFYDFTNDDGEVSIKAPFVGYRVYYQQMLAQYDKDGNFTGYKEYGWSSYKNLREYMSIDDFLKTTNCYLPITQECNTKLSLYDGNQKLVEERMLFNDDLYY